MNGIGLTKSVAVLVCDDDLCVHLDVERVFDKRTDAWVCCLTTLHQLENETQKFHFVYDIIVLDGVLENTTTLPWVEAYGKGKYPHLLKTTFILISSNREMQSTQARLIAEGKNGEALGGIIHCPTKNDIETVLRTALNQIRRPAT